MAKVVPESCQRTDGIKAWLETKEEEEIKRLEKEEKKREKEDQLNKIAEGRIARNAERQRENEMKKLEKLKKRNSVADSEAIQETEFILRELTEIIDNKGMVSIPCQDCQDCKDKNKVCSCQCKACVEVSTLLQVTLKHNLKKFPVSSLFFVDSFLSLILMVWRYPLPINKVTRLERMSP